jgi:hypothetical protein
LLEVDHARRKCVDAQPTQPAIAAESVGINKNLYAVEELGVRGQGLDVARSRLPTRGWNPGLRENPTDRAAALYDSVAGTRW